MPYSPYMLNLGFLPSPHGLEEAHVVHRLGPDQLGEVEDPFDILPACL